MESSEHCVGGLEPHEANAADSVDELCEGMTKAETELLHVRCRPK